MYFTIGTDIEFPLKSTKTGNWRSAIPLIKGTKHNPTVLKNGSLLQHDNVALEFAVPPSDQENDFVASIKDTLNIVKEILPEDIIMVSQASAHYKAVSLKNKEAQEIGCDPDFNVYTNDINHVDPTIMKNSLRSFGGHVHIGSVDWVKNTKYTSELVKALDSTLGFMSILLDDTPESRERKLLYGKAGCYRLPDHGIEYRTLSNFWLKNESLTRLVFKTVRDVINYLNNYDFTKILSHYDPQKIIDSFDKDSAHIILKQFWQKVLGWDTQSLFNKEYRKINKNNIQPDIFKEWKVAA